MNKLERDISIHDDPANDVTDLVPIIQDNMTKLLDDSKEADKGSEMSLAFKYN